MAGNIQTKQLHVLHRGCVSSVFLEECPDMLSPAISNDGPKVIKVYHKDCALQPRHWLNISREVAILRQLKELRVAGVVQLCGTVDDPSNLYLVFEPCIGGDLYRRLVNCGLLGEEQLCREVIIPLLKVLHSLHELSIIHRDIKPENIFFDAAGALCLGDFGLAINKQSDRPTSRVGTVDYMAPEVLAQPSAAVVALRGLKPSQLPSYGTAVDIWALGVLAYECLMGITPFGSTDPDVAALNAQFRRPAPLRPGVSAVCADFVSRVLAKQPAQRPSALQLLGHPWVQSYMDNEDRLMFSDTAAEWLSGSCRHALIERLTSCPDVTADIELPAPPSSPQPDLKTTCHSSNVDSGRFFNLSHHLQQSLNSQQQQRQLIKTLQQQPGQQQPRSACHLQQEHLAVAAKWQRVLHLHRQQQQRQLVPASNKILAAGPTAVPLLLRAQSAAAADLLDAKAIIDRQNSASARPVVMTRPAKAMPPAGSSAVPGGSVMATAAATEQLEIPGQRQRVIGAAETPQGTAACFGTLSTSAVPASPMMTKPSPGSSCWLLSPQPPNSTGKQHAGMTHAARQQPNLLAGLMPPRPAAFGAPSVAASAMQVTDELHSGRSDSVRSEMNKLLSWKALMATTTVYLTGPDPVHHGPAAGAVLLQQQQQKQPLGDKTEQALQSAAAQGRSQEGKTVNARRALELPTLDNAPVSIMKQILQKPDAAVVVDTAGSPDSAMPTRWWSPVKAADDAEAANLSLCKDTPASPGSKTSDISRVLLGATATIKHSLSAATPTTTAAIMVSSSVPSSFVVSADRPTSPATAIPMKQDVQRKGKTWLKRTLGMLLVGGRKSGTCSSEENTIQSAGIRPQRTRKHELVASTGC